MSTVLFKRGSSADMADTPITDGMLFFNEEDFKIYMDNSSERVQYGGDTELISDPSEALLTNAFNARGSLDLFLQKTSVIDSKNNALTITQNYVPLGCLAFKEALGTSSYAGIGDGTISGGLVNLNTRVNTAQSGVTNLQAQLRASGTNFYFDYKNGRYGWNSSSARGAGTFHPFRLPASENTMPNKSGTYALDSLPSSVTFSDRIDGIVSASCWASEGVAGITSISYSGSTVNLSYTTRYSGSATLSITIVRYYGFD